jgi:hypothetical protein
VTTRPRAISQRHLPLYKAVFKYPIIKNISYNFFVEGVLGTTAESVEIDHAKCTFTIKLSPGLIFQGSPWDLLNRPPPYPVLDEPNGVEKNWRPFDIEMRDHSAIPGLNMIRMTEAAWNQLVAKFNEGVAEGEIALCARVDHYGAPFTAIPSDVWPLFSITNWKAGTAFGPEGARLWSVHAEILPHRTRARAGAKPTYDQDEINAVVKRELKKRGGRPTPNGDLGWQSEADLQSVVADWLLRTMGKVPAKSTLQILVKKALSTIPA